MKGKRESDIMYGYGVYIAGAYYVKSCRLPDLKYAIKTFWQWNKKECQV